MGHWIKSNRPEVWAALSDAVNAALTDRGRAEVASTEERYGNVPADVAEEFVCDRIGEAMENPALVRSFARALEARGAGLGRRVLMAVRDFLERVREFFTWGIASPYVRKYDALSREVGRILAGMERAGGAAEEAAGGRRYSVAENNSYNALREIAEGKEFGVLHNPKYGEIQYPLGRAGRKGFGFLHIVESRMAKDGANLEEAIDIAVKVGIAAEIGEEVASKLNTRHFDYGNVRAIVAFDDNRNKVITGYEIVTDDASGAVRRPEDLQSVPHVSSDEIVAALKDKIMRAGGSAKHSVTSSDNFRKWFGNSKVVDKNGEPLVVYRGASFNPLEQPDGKCVIKPMSYFSADPGYAKRYGGVQAYYLRIEHPFDIRNPECRRDLESVYPGVKFARGKSGALDWAEASTVDNEFLEENFPGKYDGIIFDEASDWADDGKTNPEMARHILCSAMRQRGIGWTCGKGSGC